MAADAAIAVQVQSDVDILVARQKARTLASALRFSSGELTLIATAISEIARNIVLYARRGEIELQLVEKGRQRGVRIVAPWRTAIRAPAGSASACPAPSG